MKIWKWIKSLLFGKPKDDSFKKEVIDKIEADAIESILQQMLNTRGKYFKVTFRNQDGTPITLNGRVKRSNFKTEEGNIIFTTTKGAVITINPKDLIEILVSGVKYKK
jgi:hypothetical protein